TTLAENRKAGRRMAGSFGKKRTLSAEARERIAAAQRARWAKSKKTVKKAAGTITPVSVRRRVTRSTSAAKSAKKRTVSSEARARMAAGQKARWAKLKKAAKKNVRGAAIPAAK